MKNKFYELEPTFAKKWFWGRSITKIDCAVLAERGMRGFKGPLHVKIVDGTVPGDFLWEGFGVLIVSSKVLEIWRSFEKFETYNVIIQGNVSPVEYTGVAILGRAGPFDPVKSKAVFSKESDENIKPVMTNMEGFYFDEDKWDRSDLCTIDEFPHCSLVTEKVIKAMKQAKITNYKYHAIETIRI